jgi:hypothetical protein
MLATSKIGSERCILFVRLTSVFGGEEGEGRTGEGREGGRRRERKEGRKERRKRRPPVLHSFIPSILPSFYFLLPLPSVPSFLSSISPFLLYYVILCEVRHRE